VRAVVVCYTRFGHNKVIAEEIAKELGAEIRRIETPREYGYAVMGCCSCFNIRMAIKPMDLDFRGADLVVLCCPVWAWKPAPPARTFITNARLEGRRLAVCFSTRAGPPLRAQEKLKQLLAGRNVNLVALGDIDTNAEDEALLRSEARIFTDRLRQLG